MDPVHRVEAAVEAFLSHEGVDRKRPAIIGLSGGADSIALLVALAAAGFDRLRAVHVDHRLRPAAELIAEQALVKSLCAGYALPLTIVHLGEGQVERMGKQYGCGVEAAAHRLRHDAFRAMAKRHGAQWLFLAHHADDRFESMVMAVLGGSGVPAAGFLPPRSGWIARPFAHLRKAELIDYLQARHITWSTDSTNSELRYRRNRIRAILVPLLDREFPGWRRALSLHMRKASLDAAALDAFSAKLPLSRNGAYDSSIPLAEYLAAPEALRTRLLRTALQRAAASARPFPGHRLPSRWIGQVDRELLAGRDWSDRGFAARRRGQGLEFSPSLDSGLPAGYFVSVPSMDADRSFGLGDGLSIGVRILPEGREGCIRADRLVFPILLRNRRPGDRIALAAGGRLVDRLLSDWGIPASQRDRLPILLDREGVAAVLGGSFPSGRNAIRSGLEAATAAPHPSLAFEVKGA